jgi:hypothetical protein
MAAGNSSPEKPSKRAGTQDRSISSLTTGPTAPDCEPAIDEPGAEITSDTSGQTETWTEPVPLTVRQQKAIATSLTQGASVAAACARIKVSYECALLTYETDPRFRGRLEHIRQSLEGNVRAAQYRDAMQGNVTAQNHWLKDAAAERSAEKSRTQATPAELLADLDRLIKTLRIGKTGDP